MSASCEDLFASPKKSWWQLRLAATYASGLILRGAAAVCLNGDGSWTTNEERVEVSTPLNSFRRLTEGTVLLDHGVDPYDGVIFHETPLILAAFGFARKNLSPLGLSLIYVLSDLMSAFLLGKLTDKLTRDQVKKEKERLPEDHEDAVDLILKEDGIKGVSEGVQLTYLLHPYLIANCGGKTSTVFFNLILILFLFTAVVRKPLLATFFLAVAAYQSFYPIILILPLCCFLVNDSSIVKSTKNILLTTVGLFSAFSVALHSLSWLWNGRSWSYLTATYGFILSAPELTPNAGLFWYFFTEMFEHFRIFFLWTFQLNCFAYAVPLTVRFYRHPFLLAWTLIALIAVFKSYPCYGDVGLYTAMLPAFSHLFPHTKQMFIAGNAFLASTLLGPVLYRMWIYNGSANANYYFSTNLVFGAAHIFLITDLLFAHIRREFYLRHGYKALQPTGDPKKDLILILK